MEMTMARKAKFPKAAFAVRLDAALRVRSFCSEDWQRLNIRGVAIQAGPDGGALCVATDGHRLAIRFDSEGFSAEDVIVRLPEIESVWNGWLVGILTAPGKGHVSVVDPEDDTARSAIASVDDFHLRIGNAVIDETFVNWRRVVPPEGEPDMVRGFDSRYIASFGDYVNLRGADPMAAHLVRVRNDPDFLGVLTPTRADAVTMPEWLKEPVKAAA